MGQWIITPTGLYLIQISRGDKFIEGLLLSKLWGLVSSFSRCCWGGFDNSQEGQEWWQEAVFSLEAAKPFWTQCPYKLSIKRCLQRRYKSKAIRIDTFLANPSNKNSLVWDFCLQLFLETFSQKRCSLCWLYKSWLQVPFSFEFDT